LDKIVPTELFNVILGRPELTDLGPKLAFIKAQMEHARGASQAGYVNSKGGKDMDIGAVIKNDGDVSEAPSGGSVVWSLQSDLGRRCADGDWDAVHALSGDLFALGEGQGQE
jgi:hypothetical protein